MEFAGLFAALGSDVTVVCRGSNVLRGFDEDVRQAVAGSYTNRGIKLMFGDSIRRLERRDGGVGGGDHAGRIDVTTEQGGRLVADQVLLAFGRTPNTTSLGLDRAGVKTGADGAIIVDATRARTSRTSTQWAMCRTSSTYARRDPRRPRVRRQRVRRESLAGRLLQCADRGLLQPGDWHRWPDGAGSEGAIPCCRRLQGPLPPAEGGRDGRLRGHRF